MKSKEQSKTFIKQQAKKNQAEDKTITKSKIHRNEKLNQKKKREREKMRAFISRDRQPL